MKTIIFHFLALIFIFQSNLHSQSLTVFDIDTSGFPILKANFIAIDENKNKITNLSASDFQVKENGQMRTLTNLSCPNTKQPQNVSLAMSIDVSGSMACGNIDEKPIELVKTTSRNLINNIISPPSEFALQICNSIALIINDFTTDKLKLFSEIDTISTKNYNDFVEQLLNSKTGLLNIVKTGKNKRIAILFTDAWGEALPDNELQRCIDTCIKYNIQFNAIIYSPSDAEPGGIKSSLKALADKTNGILYDGIVEINGAKDIAIRLQQLIQEETPCKIEWQSGYNCTNGIVNIDFSLIPYNINSANIYTAPYISIASLDFIPTGVYFKNKPIGVPADTNVIITARNSDFNITNITSSDPNFDINPKSFTLQKGQSRTLVIRYIPPDSDRYFTTICIKNDMCQTDFYAIGGYSTKKTLTQTLKITHPNGGEIFVVGSDTVITWEGVLPSDIVKLSYSIDNGITWNLITDKAYGLKYIWKNIPKPPGNQYLICATQGESINNKPTIEWQKTFGGSDDDYPNSILETFDGGYIVAGNTFSNDGDINGFHGWEDAWIVKLNNKGIIEWQKCLGGKASDGAYSIKGTKDGGYIIAGFTNSNDGDVSGVHGDKDYWIVKIDSNGKLKWQKCFGGTSEEFASDIQETSDGGYVIAGYTNSNDGDVKGNHGDKDYWIVKIDSNGKLEWQKCLGGSFDDRANSIQETSDGGFIVAGITSSNDGDVSGYHGNVDYWIVKITSKGIIQWQKCFGGSRSDIAKSIQETSDGGFIIGGYTFSNDGDVIGNHGNQPYSYYWVLKINIKGVIEWQKCLGGSDSQILSSVKETSDGGFVIGGYSSSNNGDVSGNNGSTDYWIVKLRMNGDLEWQKCLGGSMEDDAVDMQETSDGGLIIAGNSKSDDGDVRGNQGMFDYWIVKLNPIIIKYQQDKSDSVFSIVTPSAGSQNIDMKQCLTGTLKDSVAVDFINNTGSFPCIIDSIYFTGADSSAFQIISGKPPYKINALKGKDVEFRFKPLRIGVHKATINIITQADTLIQTITGEGVQPSLSVINNIIDFGLVEMLNLKDTINAITIKNIGLSPLIIINTEHAGPNNIDFTILSGTGPITLNPGDTAKMDLRFLPRDEGRTSGVLNLYYNGTGSPASVSLFGTGFRSNATLQAGCADAYPGEEVLIPIIQSKGNNLVLAGVTGFDAELAFNKNLLYPLNAPASHIEGNSMVISLDSIPANNIAGTEITMLKFIAALGNAEQTDLVLRNAKPLGRNIIVDVINGLFKLEGICKEGGTRLINGDTKTELFSVSPNPANETLEIKYANADDGTAEFRLINALGQIISSAQLEKTLDGSKTIDVSNLPQGMYFGMFLTQTVRSSLKISIIK